MTTDRGSGRTLALVGVGYMGGSLVLAARAAGQCARVVGYDLDASVGEVARARGVVDAMAASPAEAARDADLVVLAGPVRSLVGSATEVADVLRSDALVIDLGSVKADVVEAVDAALPGRFVGCHPLAGTEATGVGSADPSIYVGKPCFVCPGPRASETAVARAESFWSAVGSRPVRIDAVVHDAFLAAASHLPHVAAFALAASLADAAAVVEAHMPPGAQPTSLRDTTRIAASSPIVWRDIFLANRQHLLPFVRGLEARVSSLRDAIERNDGEALERVLSEGQRLRRRLFR